jgi:hypothetical protein
LAEIRAETAIASSSKLKLITGFEASKDPKGGRGLLIVVKNI